MREVCSRLAATVVAMTAMGLTAQGQVYEFTADYCGACRTIAPLVQQLVSQGYPIEAIDVQSRPAMARRYGVDQIPCFVAVREGQVVGRVVGATGQEELVRLCQLTQNSSLTPNNSQPSSPMTIGRDEVVRGQAARAEPAEARSNMSATGSESTDPLAVARAATVRLRIEDETGHSFGTGTIIDVHDQEALVLTCGHIFRASEGKGRIMCELFCPNAPPPLEGKLVSYSMRRDVGLVSIRFGVPVRPVAVGGNGHRARQGDAVFSLGCDRGNDPSVIRNQVLAVNRYHGPANLVVGGRPIDGRSGGGLFSDDGVLIGVCNAADQEANEGLYAALGPIHAELDRAGLGFIYRPQQPAIAARTGANSNRSLDLAPADLAQASPQASLPNALTHSPSAANAAPRSPQSLSPSGTTAGGLVPPSVASAAADGDAELICIVRDQSDAAGRGRVFVIDRPSNELVRQLSQEVNRRGPHAMTQMHQSQAESATADGWRSQAGVQ